MKLSLAVIAGIGGVIALVVAYRRQRLAEAAQNLAEAGEDRERSRLYAERFDSASDKLGSDSPAVRLAGVHALANLADDWQEGRQTCIDVLSDAKFTAGRVYFSDAEFSGGTVYFYDAEFSGGTVSFRHSKFTGGIVIFGRAKFTAGAVRFLDAKFSGDMVYFGNAEFSGAKVYFDDVKVWSHPPRGLPPSNEFVSLPPT